MKTVPGFWKSTAIGLVVICCIVVAGIFFLYSQSILPIYKSLPPPVIQYKQTEETLTLWVYNHSVRISKPSANLIVKESLKTSKPLLVLALIDAESEFTPTAFSKKEAIGLTQVMFDIHGKELFKAAIIKERRDLFDIIPSIQAGEWVLNSCLTQTKGDVPKALERYLGGKDGAYLQRILTNLANLYVLTRNLDGIK